MIIRKIQNKKMLVQLSVVLLLVVLLHFQPSNAHIFSLEIHHRFSDHVKHYLSNQSTLIYPEFGTIEYYSLLARHDNHRNSISTFSDGNQTYRISSLGFLHYTSVTLGRPGIKFMVALDTGSDVFWVPCRCTQCASIADSPFSNDFELSIYDPDESSTSRNVTCNNELCPHQDSCMVSNTCPYHVSYVSSETSTSGILVEDVIHLRTLDNNPESVEAYVMFGSVLRIEPRAVRVLSRRLFGTVLVFSYFNNISLLEYLCSIIYLISNFDIEFSCGQVQTGSFLDVAAPNGLFGLGFEKISVPSVLSRKGYIANSFSMCFGHDGVGRITFGDKGSIGQEETPFKMNPFRPAYNVVVTQVRVGTTVLDSEFTALVDSGTSFTYLDDPFYTNFSRSFHAHVRDRRRPPDPRIPFEYCYIMSQGINTSLVPSMSLALAWGGQLVLNDPIIVISTLRELVYCLAVIKSRELNIIGQNFMTGYRFVFDREKLVLGWLKSDCYDIGDTNTYERKPANYASASPPGAVGALNHSTQPESPNGNTALKLVTSPLYRYLSSLLVYFILATHASCKITSKANHIR